MTEQINPMDLRPAAEKLAREGLYHPSQEHDACGVGMIVVVDRNDLDVALENLNAQGENAWHIGDIADGAGEVEYL